MEDSTGREVAAPRPNQISVLSSVPSSPRSAVEGGVAGVNQKEKTRNRPSNSTVNESPRFVGDMNPEAILLQRESDMPNESPNIGVWVGSSNEETDESSHLGQLPREDVCRTLGTRLQSAEDPDSTIRAYRRKYLCAVGVFDTLPQSTQECLVTIYFSKVHPILPLIEKTSFMHSFSEGTVSPHLVKSICLVACKDERAANYLRLSEDAPALNPRLFATKVYAALVAAVNAGLEVDRVTRIRILALMSLHSEGFSGAEAASMHLTQAIHDSQTAGLQIDRPERDHQSNSLFWCLWTLDKLNASIGGRPIMIADRDIGIAKPDIGSKKQREASDIWLEIANMLARVIDLYRPFRRTGMTSWEDDFPTFESIVGESVGPDIDVPVLGESQSKTL